jgi:hypothetical protein
MELSEKGMTIISLITSFSFPSKKDALFVLPVGMETVEDLLRYLSGELNFSLFGPKGDDIDDDLEVSINGKALWAYPQKLGTPLQEGDIVKIYMLTLGGG